MRCLALLPLLLIPQAQAGALPDDPVVQQLINGDKAPIDLGRTPVFSLFEGTLAERAAMYGATVRDRGNGDYSYICVTDGTWVSYMLSDWSNAVGEPMLSAVIEVRQSAPMPDCELVEEIEMLSLDEDRTGHSIKFPDLWAQRDPADREMVSFQSQHRMGDDGHSWLMIGTLTYLLDEDGRIDGVAHEVTVVD